MKSIIMPKTEQLTEKTNDQSTAITETQGTETKVDNIKTKFTAMDMWNRNRNSRSASDRIRKWNLN